MAVFRVERNKGYTVMSNHHLRNRELSLPEDWDYTLAGLSRINREKIDAIREAIRELERAGYIVRSRTRDENGRLRGADYVIYEQPPTSDLPTLENPTLDNPTLENPTQLNKDIQTKDPKKKDLLHVENLTIPKGAVVAVLGNNGAGKTTLARCLCGLERKMRGTFAFLGKEYTPKQRLKLCYMVMQDVNHQLFAESVLDEVTLGIKDIEEEEKTEYAQNILSMLDLLAHEDKHPMSLSGGQKQRVAIAGAIASHKEIIVYDEPTSGLDYRHMKEVSACIQKLSEMGKTQMIITHDPELVAHCCDYMVFMDNGDVSRFGEWTDENIEFVSCYFENAR